VERSSHDASRADAQSTDSVGSEVEFVYVMRARTSVSKTGFSALKQRSFMCARNQ